MSHLMRVGIGILVLFIAIAAVVNLVQKPGKKSQLDTVSIDKVTVGTQVEYGTLFHVAQEYGYFKQNKLDVTLKEYESGAPAFADLLKGQIDMTDAADFVGVRNSLAGEDFKIISSIGTTTDAWVIVARKDHGIEGPSDLRGKKIGVPEKTLGEFFLGNFFILNQIAPKDVTLTYHSPQDLKKMLLDGSLDAVMIFEPHAFNLKQQLGNAATSMPGQSGRPNYIVLYATSELVKNRPSVVERFVRSLSQAQDYLEKNPQELTTFMKSHFEYSDLYVNAVISKFRFYVALEQPMVILMEDEAKWAIESKLTTARQIPNYLNFMYFDALNTVKPDALTIIR